MGLSVSLSEEYTYAEGKNVQERVIEERMLENILQRKKRREQGPPPLNYLKNICLLSSVVWQWMLTLEVIARLESVKEEEESDVSSDAPRRSDASDPRRSDASETNPPLSDVDERVKSTKPALETSAGCSSSQKIAHLAPKRVFIDPIDLPEESLVCGEEMDDCRKASVGSTRIDGFVLKDIAAFLNDEEDERQSSGSGNGSCLN